MVLACLHCFVLFFHCLVYCLSLFSLFGFVFHCFDSWFGLFFTGLSMILAWLCHCFVYGFGVLFIVLCLFFACCIHCLVYGFGVFFMVLSMVLSGFSLFGLWFGLLFSLLSLSFGFVFIVLPMCFLGLFPLFCLVVPFVCLWFCVCLCVIVRV